MTNTTGNYYGRHHPGYQKTLREVKRNEAEARNALTTPERRRQYRLTTGISVVPNPGAHEVLAAVETGIDLTIQEI